MDMQNLLLIIGVLLVFIGVMRLIYINTSNPGNVSLARWAMTGGIVELLVGFTGGTINWIRMQPDDNSRICLFIYVGILVIYLAL